MSSERTRLSEQMRGRYLPVKRDEPLVDTLRGKFLAEEAKNLDQDFVCPDKSFWERQIEATKGDIDLGFFVYRSSPTNRLLACVTVGGADYFPICPRRLCELLEQSDDVFALISLIVDESE